MCDTMETLTSRDFFSCSAALMTVLHEAESAVKKKTACNCHLAVKALDSSNIFPSSGLILISNAFMINMHINSTLDCILNRQPCYSWPDAKLKMLNILSLA